MTLTLRYAVRSDRGLVRGNNEDSVYAGPRLLAIADGMGGHAAGEVASKIVISTLEPLDEDRPLPDMLSALREAVELANRGIADAVDRDSELDGMGTTLTALRFNGAQVGLAHVGDSRAYLMRGDHLSQITHDDTYVQSLVDQGQITADEAATHPRRSVILRALTGTAVDPDVSIREARPGDRYLLCTDGLSDVVSAETLFNTLAEGSPQECADRLVELALRGGGPDNVTCIVADVVESRYGDDVPVIAGALMDPATPEATHTDTPADRAALMTRPPRPAVGRPTGRRHVRAILVTAAVLVVVIGGLFGFYAWTQTQYFVGKDGDQVAIFRGVNTQLGPLKFFSVQEHTALAVDQLNVSARSQVSAGINADNKSDAESIVVRLSQELLPICPTVTATPSPTSIATPTRTPTRAPTRATTARPTAHTTAHTTAKASPTVTPTPAYTPTPSATPGVTCR